MEFVGEEKHKFI